MCQEVAMLLIAKKGRLLWTLLIHDLLTGTSEMFPKATKTELLPDSAVLGENLGQNIKPMDFFPQHAGFRSSGSVEDFMNISKSGFRCVLSYNKAVLTNCRNFVSRFCCLLNFIHGLESDDTIVDIDTIFDICNTVINTMTPTEDLT